MKRILALLLIFFTLCVSSQNIVLAKNVSKVSIEKKNVSGTSSALKITGFMPIIKGLSNEDFQNKLNRDIEALFDSFSQKALKDNAASLSVNFDVKKDSDNYHILIYDTINFGTAKNEISSINFDSSNNNYLTLEDFMGVNAYSLTNKYISSEIKKSSKNYYKDFKVTNQPAFFVKDNSINFLFSETEVSSGYNGINDEFKINLKKIIDFKLKNDEYITEQEYNLKMIPLRLVAEGLGYKVGWNQKTSSSTISKDSFSTEISKGKNSYGGTNKRELESAPENIKGTLYVPVSFFDSILDISYYSDKNGNIIFSKYTAN